MEDSQNEFIKKHWFQIGLLVIGAFIAWTIYSALVLQPEKTRQGELSRQAEATAAAETKEAEKKENLDACLTNAREVYDKNWDTSCRTLGRLTNRCETILFGDAPFKDYLSWHPELANVEVWEQFSAFQKAKEECSCALPRITSDRWDSMYKDDQKVCYDLYK
jgi:hypothetical protein